tara:strand:- start:24 stop:254 length:231 start_codon:yes stop_codon:yes gene_type:complete
VAHLADKLQDKGFVVRIFGCSTDRSLGEEGWVEVRCDGHVIRHESLRSARFHFVRQKEEVEAVVKQVLLDVDCSES